MEKKDEEIRQLFMLQQGRQRLEELRSGETPSMINDLRTIRLSRAEVGSNYFERIDLSDQVNEAKPPSPPGYGQPPPRVPTASSIVEERTGSDLESNQRPISACSNTSKVRSIDQRGFFKYSVGRFLRPDIRETLVGRRNTRFSAECIFKQ